MIVMKFGGSSVSDAECIRKVAGIIKEKVKQKPIVVISAMGDTTDAIIEASHEALEGKASIEYIRKLHYNACNQLGISTRSLQKLLEELQDLLVGISLIKELSNKTHDYLLSFGERLSVRVVAAYLHKTGLPARHYDAWDLGLVTNSAFGNAEAREESYKTITKKMMPFLDAYTHTPIVTGFVAKDRKGNITTLGRGGSDLTASIIGAAVGAMEIQVWKDVDGLLTTDPVLVPGAKPVPEISFEEASELAYFGAQILHPRSILPAMKKNIPVRIKNTFNPEHPGTVIKKSIGERNGLLRAVTFKRNVILVDITSTRMLGQHGFLAKVFQIFEDVGVSVDMVATSEVSVSLTLDEKRNGWLEDLQERLEKIAQVRLREQKSIITLVGDVERSSEILEKGCRALKQLGVNVQMISQGASKVNISFIIEDSELQLCIKELHTTFFGGK